RAPRPAPPHALPYREKLPAAARTNVLTPSVLSIAACFGATSIRGARFARSKLSAVAAERQTPLRSQRARIPATAPQAGMPLGKRAKSPRGRTRGKYVTALQPAS